MTRRLGRSLALSLVLGAIAFGAPAHAAPAVEDNLPAFLEAVRDGSGESWLTFETAQSKTLDQLFYKDRSSAQKLALARNGLYDGVPLDSLRRFADRWRTDYDAVAGQLDRMFGGTPPFKVSMWYVLDTRAGVYGELDGLPMLALNARKMLPYDPQRTRLLIAQEFFRYHASQSGAPAEGLTLGRRLQLTGLNLVAMRRAVPGLSLARYLEVSPETAKAYERHKKLIAKTFLAALDAPASANAIERFFGKGQTGDPFPPGAGRYLAMLAAQEMTREGNPLESYALPSQDYMFSVRPALESLAGAVEAP